jgi:hypothetical protein
MHALLSGEGTTADASSRMVVATIRDRGEHAVER